MWFRSEDRLTNETQGFTIINNEDLKLSSIVWEIGGNSRIIYETFYYGNCQERLDIIQDVLVGNDTLIDLRCNYVNDSNEQSQKETTTLDCITVPTNDEIMDYLRNNDKFVSYEEYKKEKELPKIEKKSPIIATPEELQQKLHEYRRANGWNMSQVSKTLGLPTSTTWQWFKGANLPVQKKHRDILAKALNVRFERDM